MSQSPTVFTCAREFMRNNGRVLEQRLAECALDGAGPDAVVAAVGAYRNLDGGFGHALEPDTRCPHSQPLYAQVALEALATARATPGGRLLGDLCDHLASVAGTGGAVPIMLPSFAAYPKATHWEGIDGFPPALNPTAAIAGLLHQFGVTHPWLDDATGWCSETLHEEGLPTEAHALRCVLVLLEHAPDRVWAEALADGVAAGLPGVAYYRADPLDPDYGLTPLDLAPDPASRWRSLFDDELVTAHLDQLLAEQQPDGGWPIRWEPPSELSTWEWRGIVTLRALSTLVADGRAGPD